MSSSRPGSRLLVLLAQLAGGSHAALSTSPAPTAASILQNCERALPTALPEDAATRILGYVEELLQYNERTNVYSKSAYGFLPFHVADSATLATHIGGIAQHGVLDLGSGSGLPSVIIACVNPSLPVFAVESKSRKTRFLRHAAKRLELEQYTALTQDVRQLSRDWAFDVDVVTAKAFKPLPEVKPIGRRCVLSDARLLIPISEAQVREFELGEDELQRYEGGFLYYSEPITPSHGSAQRKVVTKEAAKTSKL